MSTPISNRATLSYRFGESTGTTTSNTATTVLEGPLKISLTTLESTYRRDTVLTFLMHIKNTGSTAVDTVVAEDNLGSYLFPPVVLAAAEATVLSPLSYVGPAHVFINEEFSEEIEPDVLDNSVRFSIAAIPAQATALIVYKAATTEFAPLVASSFITSTATATATGINTPVEAEHTVTADSYADVKIEKTMSPNPVVDGAQLTYTFVIENYGNHAAEAIKLMDTFDEAAVPENLSVTINGVPYTEADYTEGTLLIPGAESAYDFSLAAAEIVQNTLTGEVSVKPTKKTVIVRGTI